MTNWSALDPEELALLVPVEEGWVHHPTHRPWGPWDERAFTVVESVHGGDVRPWRVCRCAHCGAAFLSGLLIGTAVGRFASPALSEECSRRGGEVGVKARALAILAETRESWSAGSPGAGSPKVSHDRYFFLAFDALRERLEREL